MSADDELERRLRNVFRSRRLSIDSDAGLLDRVHAGAVRRHRRRVAATAAAGTAVIAVVGIVAGSVTLQPRGMHHVAADQNHVLSPSSTISATPPMSTSVPSTTSTFFPMSVTAVSTTTYWVLGSTSCPYESRCLELRRTTDGGKTFTSLPAPALAGAPSGVGAKGWVAMEIRFGSTTMGWAYGAGGLAPYFFQTTDGGGSWLQVTQIPGRVVDVVAANGEAWAVVDTAPANSTSAQWAIYSTVYGSGAQHWAKATMPIELGSMMPSIVDQDGTVTVLVSGPSRAGHHDHVLVAKPGGPFTDHEGPCSQEAGARLSNSKRAIWAACSAGSSVALFISTDRGATWKATDQLETPDPGLVVGAIDDQHAIVMDNPSGALLRLGIGGPGQPVDAPANGATGASFIGFTTQDAGFAIVYQQGGTTELLRTADGGLHWTRVQINP